MATKAAKSTFRTKEQAARKTAPKKAAVKSARKETTKAKTRQKTKQRTVPQKQTSVGEKGAKHLDVRDTTPSAQSIRISTERLQLALLSPFRFPINYDRVAVQAARYGGIFFVFVGAIFAAVNLMQFTGVYASLEKVSNLALTCTYNDMTCDEAWDYYNCDTWADLSYDCIALEDTMFVYDLQNSANGTLGSTSTNTEPTLDPEPGVVFTTNPATDLLSGMVEIFYEVPYAETVDALVYYQDEDRIIELGRAVMVTDTTWKYYWQTDDPAYPDGEYQLKAVVTNQFGTYDSVGGPYVAIHNTVEPTAPDPVPTDTKPAVELSLGSTLDGTVGAIEPTEVTGLINVSAQVDYANSIKIRLKDDTSTHSLGTADYDGGTSWTFHRWDTRQYADGDYVLSAIVTNEYGTYESGRRNIYINNVADSSADTDGTTTDTVTTTDPEPTDTTELTEPQIELSLENEPPLHDTVGIFLTVDNADAVSFIVMYDDTGTEYVLGRAVQTATDPDTWILDWDTTQYPDGSAEVYGKVTVAGSRHYSNRTSVTIENEPSILVDENTTEEVADTTLRPQLTLSFSESSPLDGTVKISTKTSGAKFIELYAKPEFASQSRFLGLAREGSGGLWTFYWNTTDTPNGTYTVYGQVQNVYGLYETGYTKMRVYNEVVEKYTIEQQTHIEELEDAASESSTDTLTESQQSTDASVDVEGFITESQSKSELMDETAELLRTFERQLREELAAFAVAYRNSNKDDIEAVRERMRSLRTEILESVRSYEESEDLITRINEHLEKVTASYEAVVARNEQILRERVGEAIYGDSDSDNISDYDEIHIYKTNPFSADTDGDGFVDSAEILGGYDPNDPRPEVLVAYESPKEQGIKREDLLKVESVTAIEKDIREEDTEQKPLAALIRGKALPNSFVTLYVFSTPIVVTVKTGDDGSWSYVFDKELEDGEHEVYIGITDNAGKIVAKSSPFAFTKTAQAFTPADAAAETVVSRSSSEPSLFMDNAALLVLSIIVVLLGLVLLIIGLHLQSRHPSPSLVVQ